MVVMVLAVAGVVMTQVWKAVWGHMQQEARILTTRVMLLPYPGEQTRVSRAPYYYSDLSRFPTGPNRNTTDPDRITTDPIKITTDPNSHQITSVPNTAQPFA